MTAVDSTTLEVSTLIQRLIQCSQDKEETVVVTAASVAQFIIAGEEKETTGDAANQGRRRGDFF